MKLYRAVSESEFQDLMQTHQFRVGPNSLEGKFFAESIDDAAKWGCLLEGVGNFRVIEVNVPQDVVSRFMRWEMLDGIGPAYFAEFDQLANISFHEVET